MAIAAVDGERLWILDQVQSRLVRLDGGALGTSVAVPVRVAQDLVIADGLLLVLDRLGDATVVAIDAANGQERWRLPLVGDDLDSGSGVSALLVRGGDVWVEVGHTDSVRIGGLDGTLRRGARIPGRPSRDGRLGLAAFRSPPDQVLLTGHALGATNPRDLPPAWSAAARFALPVFAVRALQSDSSGAVWLAVNTMAEGEGDAIVDEQLEVVRFDAEGHETFRDVASPEVGPEEQFRTFSCAPDGALWHLARDEDGATIERWTR